MSGRTEALLRDYEDATARFDAIVARYNAEYLAGLWDTNRTLAGASETAYDEMIRAKMRLDEHLIQRGL